MTPMPHHCTDDEHDWSALGEHDGQHLRECLVRGCHLIEPDPGADAALSVPTP